jgi:hypothetical protein
MLKGTIFGGTVAIGLPMLDAMMPRTGAAQTGTAPKRVVFWFTANGTRQDIWSPPANMDLNGHPLHAAMAPFSNKLIFLDGVDQDVAYDSIGDGHQTGMACILTNAEILPGTLFCEGNCDAGNEQYVGWGGGQSVDQYIADEIAKDVVTKFKSLELGVQVRSSSVWSRMSYSAPDQPVPPREDPNQNFTDFFSDIESDPFALRLIQRRRKSVLDAVMEDHAAFQNRLGYDDKQKLDKHLQSIRDLEQRLAVTTNLPAVDPRSGAKVGGHDQLWRGLHHARAEPSRKQLRAKRHVPVNRQGTDGHAGHGPRMRPHARRIASMVTVGERCPVQLGAADLRRGAPWPVALR